MVDLVLLVPPALVVASVSLPTWRPRRAGLAAVLLIQLAIASLVLTGGLTDLRASLTVGYQSITAAMLLAGLLLIATISVIEIRAPREPGKGSRALLLGGALLTLLVAIEILRIALPLMQGGGVLRTVAALAGMGGAGVLLTFAVRQPFLRRGFGWLEQRLVRRRSTTPNPDAPRGKPAMLGLHLAGVLLALAAPNLPLLVLGVFLATAFGAVWEHQAGAGPRAPVGAIIGMIALFTGAGLLYQVAGETPLQLDDMLNGPFSPAFQTMAALVLALAAWPLLRLWPLHGTRTGPASALAGAAILVRVLTAILPEGNDHWQPVFYVLLAFGSWYGAVVRNDALLAAALASAGLLSGFPEAGWGGVAALTAAIVLQSLARATSTVPVALIAGRVILIGASFAIVPLLVGALQVEVFCTVCIVAGAVTGLLAAEDRRRVDRGPSLV